MSEVTVTLATVVALLIVGNSADDSLTTFRTWTLVTVVCSAYIVSRGLAKIGSPKD